MAPQTAWKLRTNRYALEEESRPMLNRSLKAMSLSTATLALPAASGALDKGYEPVLDLMGSEFRRTDAGELTLFFVIALTVVVALILFARYYEARQMRAAAAPRARRPRTAVRNFKQQAATLGLRLMETRNLFRIASKLSPKSPQTLLSSRTGRKYLVADLGKRIQRRERELSMLRGILNKLEDWGDRMVVDRETARVDTDLPIWIVKKVNEDGAAGDAVVNLEPVPGRLLDLSAGGAAVTADVGFRVGELVEFWSADTQVWIPPTAAGVVHVDEAEEGSGSPPPVHLHFLNAPITEIRRAVREIARADGGQDVAEPASGEMCHVA